MDAEARAGFDWAAESQRLLDEHGAGMTTEQYIANLRLALLALRARVAAVERELVYANAVIASHGQVECGHISEGTGDEPDRCRICVAEARAETAEQRNGTHEDIVEAARVMWRQDQRARRLSDPDEAAEAWHLYEQAKDRMFAILSATGERT